MRSQLPMWSPGDLTSRQRECWGETGWEQMSELVAFVVRTPLGALSGTRGIRRDGDQVVYGKPTALRLDGVPIEDHVGQSLFKTYGHSHGR